MFQLAICDDRKQDLEKAVHIVSEQGPLYTVHPFTSARGLLQAHERTPFDIVVLDVLLGDDSGIDLAAQLQATQPALQTIFMSSTNSFMYDSYQVPHVWYINKQDVATLLPKALQRAKDALEKDAGARLVLRCGKLLQMVPCREVLYFEQVRRKTFVHTAEGVFSQYGKLSNCVQEGQYPAFVQCHKSFFVNMDAVQTVARDHLILSDGTSLPISRSCLANIHSYLIDETRRQILSVGEEGPNL